MSITKIKEPFAGITYYTAAASGVFYKVFAPLSAGVYEITCISTTNATVTFWNGTTVVAEVTTVSGIVTVDLAQSTTHFVFSTNTGTNVQVGIVQTGITRSVITGTLDTISATGSYASPAPSLGNILIIGAGGGGSPGGSGNGGGGSGYLEKRLEYPLSTASVSVVIGAGGAAQGVGGTTTFDGISASGGDGATGYPGAPGGSGGGTGTNGSPGSPGGANGNNGSGNPFGPGGTGSGDSWTPTHYGVTAGAGGTGSNRSPSVIPGGGGGGIYGGGGGGAGNAGKNSGGGGGGGGVSGNNGTATSPGGTPDGPGGTGGDGRVYVLRWPS